MNKKIINRFDPFMPVKITGVSDENNIVNSNFDEFVGEIPGFTTSNDKIKINTPFVKKGFTILITQKGIGRNEVLGEKLLEDFICSLSDSVELPQYVIFMNEGIYLLDNKNIYTYILKMKKYGVSFLVSMESAEHLEYNKSMKGIVQATSADISEKILFSEKIINF